MKSLTFSNVVKKGFDVYQKGFVIFVLLGMVAGAVSIIGEVWLNDVIGIEDDTALYVVSYVITSIISGLILVFILVGSLNIIDGKKISKNMFLSVDRWVNLLIYAFVVNILLSSFEIVNLFLPDTVSDQTQIIVYILMGIASMVVVFLLILVYLFVDVIIVDKGSGMIEALKKSAGMTKGNRLNILGIILLILLLSVVAFFAIAFILGIISYAIFGEDETAIAIFATMGVAGIVAPFWVCTHAAMYKILDKKL